MAKILSMTYVYDVLIHDDNDIDMLFPDMDQYTTTYTYIQSMKDTLEKNGFICAMGAKNTCYVSINHIHIQSIKITWDDHVYITLHSTDYPNKKFIELYLDKGYIFDLVDKDLDKRLLFKSFRNSDEITNELSIMSTECGSNIKG